MKTTFNLSNWFKNNTPKAAQIVGDIGLVIAFINTNFLSFNYTNLSNNPTLQIINEGLLAAGILVKIISKFFGQIEALPKYPTQLTPEEVKEAIPFALYQNLKSSTQVIETFIKQLQVFDQNHPAIKALLSNKQLMSDIDNIQKSK